VQAFEKAIAVQRANVAAAQASLARIEVLKGYRLVKAPFAGVITLRNVDRPAMTMLYSALYHSMLMPVDRTGDTITVALPDPSNVFILDELRLLTKCQLVPVISFETDIENAEIPRPARRLRLDTRQFPVGDLLHGGANLFGVQSWREVGGEGAGVVGLISGLVLGRRRNVDGLLRASGGPG